MTDAAHGASPQPEIFTPATPAAAADQPQPDGAGPDGGPRAAAKRRRRGSRGGRNRSRTRPSGSDLPPGSSEPDEQAPEEGPPDKKAGDEGVDDPSPRRGSRPGNRARPALPPSDEPTHARATVRRKAGDDRRPDELPERLSEGRIKSPEIAEQALVRRPQIGDSRPAPAPIPAAPSSPDRASKSGRRRRGGRGRGSGDRTPVRAIVGSAVTLDEEALARRKGRERKGRPVGRYLMAVHVTPQLTQIAVLEGRNLIEHYVSRPSDDVNQIHGNIYLGRVQNVLPGMEAAFVDIGTPKNAVLYRGDVQYDAEDIVEKGERLRIEQMLKPRQMILCQVTKNPIGAKGARLTQEVSLPGRFVVLIPNSRTYGISKRLPDDERKRLRSVLDKVKPAEHGVIVRTAAENVVEEELRADVLRLLNQWEQIEAFARKAQGPTLLYREPDMAVRVIREEFNKEYRGVVIDDRSMFDEVNEYVGSISPALADRVEFYDAAAEGLPLFERHHVHEQVHKALDRKVWLPSGGSLIIEHAEALTVIDVNTGKNVGSSSLEETVLHNNLEAAAEIARQLRLRDIGGIIVIDFIDMEVRDNRQKVVAAFREALSRDKTRTQVFDISELGLVEMTRKRIGEGLLTSFADRCPMCDGRGVLVDHSLLE